MTSYQNLSQTDTSSTSLWRRDSLPFQPKTLPAPWLIHPSQSTLRRIQRRTGTSITSQKSWKNCRGASSTCIGSPNLPRQGSRISTKTLWSLSQSEISIKCWRTWGRRIMSKFSTLLNKKVRGLPCILQPSTDTLIWLSSFSIREPTSKQGISSWKHLSITRARTAMR